MSRYKIEGLMLIILGLLWMISSIKGYRKREKKPHSLEGYYLIKFIGGSISLITLGVIVFFEKTSLIDIIRDFF